MTTVLTITNQKGGVAKTTTSVSVGHELARRGYKTLIVDLDPQGQDALALELEPYPGVFSLLVTQGAPETYIRPTGRENLDIIGGDRTTGTAQIVLSAENRPISAIADVIKPLRERYEWILFDTAPSVGGLQERAIFAADLVLVPTACEFLSSDGVSQVLDLLRRLRNQGWRGGLMGILPTMYDERTTESRTTLSQLQGAFPEHTLPPIHRATVFRELAARGQTIFEYLPDSRAAQQYSALTDTVLKFRK